MSHNVLYLDLDLIHHISQFISNFLVPFLMLVEAQSYLETAVPKFCLPDFDNKEMFQTQSQLGQVDIIVN